MTEATCQICRRYRPLMADKRVCFPCSVGTSHTCPICQDIVPGGGRAPCYRCSQLRRAKIQIATEAATIPHPWLADLFKTYCTSSDLSLDDGKTNGRITRAAAACRRIATTVTNPSDLTTDALHAALGAESLRRVAPLIAYWTEIGVLDWDRARLQTLIERDRIAVILKTHQDAPHAALLQSYRDHLAIRDRKPITQRTALTSALALLETLGDAPLADLTDRHLARTLRKRPGHRASLQGFLRFIAAQGGPDLRPRTPFRRDPIAQERALRAEISLLRKRLEKPRSVAEARALLALLISRLYALPLPRVLALRSEDVVVERVRLTLWPEADAIDIDKPLADKFRQWIAWSPMWKSVSRPWVFPGRHGHQPLSETAVTYHLKSRDDL